MTPRFRYPDPPALPRDVLRELDRDAIETFAVPGIVLMENAGEGFVAVMLGLAEDPSTGIGPPFHIVCGAGNNAGDGFVIARQLANRGAPVRVYLVRSPARFRPDSDAGRNLEAIRRMGVEITESEDEAAMPQPLGASIVSALSEGTIVDAIFGLDRPVRAPESDWIEAINASGRPVVAVDLPSGLHADTGEVLGVAVRAQHTVTFVAPKLGFERGDGPAHVGAAHVVGISVPRSLLEERCGRGGGRAPA